MGVHLRQYWKQVTLIMVVVCALGMITFLSVSPGGYLGDLENDLKVIEPDDGQMYTDLSGNPVNLHNFRGKPIIINSWATWTPFSQTELPILARLAHTYAQDIYVLAINRMEQVGTVRSFLSVYPVSEDFHVLLDPSDHFYTSINGYAMPETLVYDKDGVKVYHARGVFDEAELTSILQTLTQ